MNHPKSHIFEYALSAEDLVIAGECPASLDELRASLHEDHQPANTTESMLVNEIAEQFWRLRRMRAGEARGMQPDTIDGSLGAGLLAFVARSMAAAERGLHRAISTLRRLQADRGFVPSETKQPASLPDEAAGFVPSKTRQPAPAPAERTAPTVAGEPTLEPKPPSAPPQKTPAQKDVDISDLDVASILADYDEDLHPIVLEDIAELQEMLKRRNRAA